MRIYFHSTAVSLHRHIEGFAYSNGTFAPLHPTITQLKPSFHTTGNRGNMIHSEAIMRLLDRNVGRCASGNIVHVQSQLKDRFVSEMNRQFDLVVLSMANCVTKNRDHTKLVEVLEQLEIPVYVFGVGMQDPLPEGNPKPLTESTQRLIQIFAKCEFFSVRGERTAAWLRSVGCEPHTIGGCPSLYAFPNRISQIDYSRVPSPHRLVTGGHISENNINGVRKGFSRGYDLVRVFKGATSSYVMQDEIFHYSGLVDKPGVFDSALNELDAAQLNGYALRSLGIDLPFSRYYFFDQPATWRRAMAQYEAFVGDRFHGGVASMQASVPAAFITSDQRMTELAEYFGVPMTLFSDIGEGGVADILGDLFTKEANDRFHEAYRARLGQFRNDMSNAGLKLADDRPLDELLVGYASQR